MNVRCEQFAWLLAQSITRNIRDEESDEVTQTLGHQKEKVRSARIPVWSGYNSIVSDVLPVTRVGTPPLLAAPAHEWNTLLTVLM